MAQPTVKQVFQLAIQHHQAGRLAEAENLYRQILSEYPNHPATLQLLGVVAQQTGNSLQAAELIRRSLAIDPNSPDAHSNLAIAFKDLGQLDEAISSCRKAISLRPDFADAHGNLGFLYQRKNQLDEAIAHYRKAARLNHANADVHFDLGNVLAAKRLLDEAIAAFRQSITLNPRNPNALNNLGIVLTDRGNFEEAVAAFQKAIALQPHFPEAYNNLATAFKDRGDLDEALAAYQKAVALRPEYAEAHSNLSIVLKDLGRLDESIAASREALRLNPRFSDAHSKLIFALHYHPAYDAPAIAAELASWNHLHAEPLKTFIQPHNNDRRSDRPLRIGYVSPDFRDHVVGQNLVPLFLNRNRRDFEVFCYSNFPTADLLTLDFRKHCDHWREISEQTDEQVANQIRQDKIDILVDLAMHTARNRLLVFARKPAPIQVCAFAYPGSTGLETIDYRFTDSYLDPPEAREELYSEKSIRLPDSFWCYHPLHDGSSPLPAVKNGYVTFGCLNNFCKITQPTLDLWRSVLTTTPNSRFIMLAPPGSARTRVLETLDLPADRIEIFDRQPRDKYFELYNRIDIGLDTIPYNGHTTSLDSLWMGVPVVTLVGKTVVGRAGWCQLRNLGLENLAAQSPDEFVRIASRLAADMNKLADLRAGLRKRMQESSLMDGPKFAAGIESAYRAMWRTWCEAPGPKSV